MNYIGKTSANQIIKTVKNGLNDMVNAVAKGTTNCNQTDIILVQQSNVLKRYPIAALWTLIKEYTDSLYATQTDLAKLDTINTVTLNGGSSWGDSAPYQQTLTVTGITAESYPIWYVVPSEGNDTVTEDEYEAFCCITSLTTSADTVTFTCTSERPETAVSIVMKGI